MDELWLGDRAEGCEKQRDYGMHTLLRLRVSKCH